MKKAALILAALVVVTIASFWFLMLRSHEFISTTQVDRCISIAASAPPIISRSGAAFAIVTGELNGTAKIEIVGNRGRDKEQFEVGPGGFELARVRGGRSRVLTHLLAEFPSCHSVIALRR
jgi:hypothetical protein